MPVLLAPTSVPIGVPSRWKPEKRKRIETVIGSLKSVWYFSMAERIIAWMAFDLGSSVIVLSNVGLITKPELVLGVVIAHSFRTAADTGRAIRPDAIVILRPSVKTGNDAIGHVAKIQISIVSDIAIK
jgi:hypothetical protein